MPRKKIGNEYVDVFDSQLGNNPPFRGIPGPYSGKVAVPKSRGGRLPKEPGAFPTPQIGGPRKRK